MAILDRVRGYTIPGQSLAGYLVGIFPQWGPNVIEDSIFLVRQGENARQYVVFNTTVPIRVFGFGEASANIGRSIGNAETFKGFALDIEEASRLGLYSAGVAQSIEPTDKTIAGERRRGQAGREYMRQETQKDKNRNLDLLGDDLARGLGSVSATIVNVIGKTLGKAAGGFVGSLGPYGVLALTIAAGAATAYYVVPLVKAANRGK